MSTTTKHTPGPWRIAHEERSGICNVVWDLDHDGRKIPYLVAGIVGFGYFQDGKDFSEAMATRDANARLIAAAPELLAYAILEHEWRDCEGDATRVRAFEVKHHIRLQTPADWLKELRVAAIAKATGGAK